MTKVGQLLFEEGMEQGERKERLVAVRNLLKLHVSESQILEMYSWDDLRAARELWKEK